MTYFVEWGNGRWTAFAIRIEGQADDGGWIVRSDFKTASGECRVWFRSDSFAAEDSIDLVPIGQEVLRLSPSIGGDDLTDDPQLQSYLAANLLAVRRYPHALTALHEPYRSVQYPCGIDRVHRFITPGPGYEKHHDLNPRVLVTGVACLSIDDGETPTVATSFGVNDPARIDPTSYDDFVDFSHCMTVAHDSFVLAYPATWFLVLQGAMDDQGTNVQDYMAQVGGASCACTLSLRIRRGPIDRLTEIRKETLARLGVLGEGPMGTFTPQLARRSESDGHATATRHRFENTLVDGWAYGAVVSDSSGERLAQVNVLGCVSKASPRREATLLQMTDVLPDIVDSFRFLSDERASKGLQSAAPSA